MPLGRCGMSRSTCFALTPTCLAVARGFARSSVAYVAFVGADVTLGVAARGRGVPMHVGSVVGWGMGDAATHVGMPADREVTRIRCTWGGYARGLAMRNIHVTAGSGCTAVAALTMRGFGAIAPQAGIGAWRVDTWGGGESTWGVAA